MTTVTTHYNAPLQALNIKDTVDSMDNIGEFIFAIQLSYRENHTIYHLKDISTINFRENYIEIRHSNGSCNYFSYDDIREYHIINADDLCDLWGE